MPTREVGNIGQLTDISGRRKPEDGDVEITIWTDRSSPLRGRVRLGDDQPVDFEGWLELLSALESALRADVPAHGFGGELDPGAQAQLPEDV
jgi:hypothetical protein